MREQPSSNRFGCRRLASMHLRAALATGLIWLMPAAADAQMTLPTTPPSVGMSATSPLNLGATRPEGIPLGSTEIATPGISPINPSLGMTNCAPSGNAGSSGAPFDGGGLSGSSSLACQSGTTTPSALPPQTSTIGRVGIPLGSTELGGAGISPSVPVPGPTSMGGTTSGNSSGNP
ncbi:hypothetical protein N2603_10100 [Bradyrhizobium huanghuaihaiense]|uniref:hypothetical protein n=1 Tax=Bradyrhizobium huanghuaihaiense TaxID=990078 RepID=UPI0021A99AB8|nr:hypothetical protein [Bradyrhizobium sp. CB3035]UWU78780.1 hypothetical protein N2603_10100 [Bradyrhizobium sp. CB3035]